MPDNRLTSAAPPAFRQASVAAANRIPARQNFQPISVTSARDGGGRPAEQRIKTFNNYRAEFARQVYGSKQARRCSTSIASDHCRHWRIESSADGWRNERPRRWYIYSKQFHEEKSISHLWDQSSLITKDENGRANGSERSVVVSEDFGSGDDGQSRCPQHDRNLMP